MDDGPTSFPLADHHQLAQSSINMLAMLGICLHKIAFKFKSVMKAFLSSEYASNFKDIDMKFDSPTTLHSTVLV